MIYSNHLIDICDQSDHKWSGNAVIYSARKIGELAVYQCNNCMTIKVVQRVVQFNGTKCLEDKVTTTIVEPKP